LDMNWLPHRWQLDVECCAFAGRGADIHFSRMFLDDSVAYGKSQAGASTTGLGGKKRIENPVNVFAGNSCASIDDLNLDASIVRTGPHFQDAAGRHGIARVEKKIQEHLLQLVGGATHRR